MSLTGGRVATIHPSISFLLREDELRFLFDLMQDALHQIHAHPIPELGALLVALERMWGDACARHLTVSPGLMYYLVVYAAHAHLIHEDAEGWRRGSGHEVHPLLQGVMESVARAIRSGAVVQQRDDGMYIDLFRIPQWFYDAVIKDKRHVNC